MLEQWVATPVGIDIKHQDQYPINMNTVKCEGQSSKETKQLILRQGFLSINWYNLEGLLSLELVLPISAVQKVLRCWLSSWSGAYNQANNKHVC